MSSLLTRQQWDKILCHVDADDRLEALQQAGTIRLMFPEIQTIVGFGDGTEMKDLWAHTKQVVVQAIQFSVIRWAALFHDVGKPRCFTKAADGTIAFHNHEAVSARLFRQAAQRTRFFNEEEEKTIYFLIFHLGRVEEYDSSWTDSAVRRLHRHTKDHFNDLVALSRADISTKNQAKRQAHMQRMHELKKRAWDLDDLDSIPAALPSGLGDVLTAEFGIPPSRALGDLMKALTAAVEAEEMPRQSSPEDLVAFIRENPDRFGIKP